MADPPDQPTYDMMEVKAGGPAVAAQHMQHMAENGEPPVEEQEKVEQHAFRMKDGLGQPEQPAAESVRRPWLKIVGGLALAIFVVVVVKKITFLSRSGWLEFEDAMSKYDRAWTHWSLDDKHLCFWKENSKSKVCPELKYLWRVQETSNVSGEKDAKRRQCLIQFTNHNKGYPITVYADLADKATEQAYTNLVSQLRSKLPATSA